MSGNGLDRMARLFGLASVSSETVRLPVPQVMMASQITDVPICCSAANVVPWSVDAAELDGPGLTRLFWLSQVTYTFPLFGSTATWQPLTSASADRSVWMIWNVAPPSIDRERRICCPPVLMNRVQHT